MTSSDDGWKELLFNWLTSQIFLDIVLESGVVAFEGRGRVLRFEDDGLDIGTAGQWELTFWFASDGESSVRVPSDRPNVVRVLIRSGTAKLLLTGKLSEIRRGPI